MRLQELFPGLTRGGSVLVLGELLLDFVPGDDSVGLADPGSVLKTVSGSAGIYACALAGFGVPCKMLCKLGTDPFSKLAKQELAKAGVGTEYIVRSDSRAKLGIAFLEYTPTGRNYVYYRDGSVGSSFMPEEIPEAAFPDAMMLHLPGMLLDLNDNMRQSCFRAVELAKKHNVLVSFDPNIRKELRGDPAARERMMQMVSLADVIEPTLDEAKLLTGCAEIPDILHALHAAGPRLVVLTWDKQGAFFSCAEQRFRIRGIDIPVTDPTGAGDTFAAAMAYGIYENLKLEDAARFSNCAATLVCVKRGAIGMALPNLRETEEFLRRASCVLEPF